jgi:uncharacterized phosphosugar-binding protein
MNQIVVHETGAIGSAAQLCAEVIAQGGVIHVFGTGHSSHQAADTFYRAGGLACVNAILESFLSIGVGALLSTETERQTRIGKSNPRSLRCEGWRAADHFLGQRSE